MASIEKRGENSFRIIVSGGFGGSGKRIFKKKTVTLDPGLTEKQRDKELQKLAALFESEVLNGNVVDGSIKLKDYADKWLRDYAKTTLQPKTLVLYEGEIKNRILPALGHKRLEKIKPLDLLSFYNNLLEDGMRLDKKPGILSDRTIKLQHQILSSMFSSAVKWQMISSNPCANVSPPKREQATLKKIKHFNEHEISVFLELMQNQPTKYKAAILIALFGGLRRAEVLGLTWTDIDYASNTIDINKSSVYVTGYGQQLTTTKNRSSNRKVILPKPVMEVIKALETEQKTKRLKLGESWKNENDLLFVTWDGHPMADSAPYRFMKKLIQTHNEEVHRLMKMTAAERRAIQTDNDMIKRMAAMKTDDLKQMMLPDVGFHSLRHTSATMLIHGGMNVKAVSSRLGHSETSITMNIYAHALQSADQQSADMLESMMKLPGSDGKVAK